MLIQQIVSQSFILGIFVKKKGSLGLILKQAESLRNFLEKQFNKMIDEEQEGSFADEDDDKDYD